MEKSWKFFRENMWKPWTDHWKQFLLQIEIVLERLSPQFWLYISQTKAFEWKTVCQTTAYQWCKLNCRLSSCVPNTCSYIWIGPHTLMYLNTVLHGSHLVVQFGQAWHQLTYLSSGKKTSLCGQWCTRYRPCCPTARIRSISLIVVCAKSFLDSSRPLSLHPTQMGSRFIRPLCMRPAANHESYGQRVSTHEVWRRTEFPTWSRWWCSPLAGVYRGYNTRQMKNEKPAAEENGRRRTLL